MIYVSNSFIRGTTAFIIICQRTTKRSLVICFGGTPTRPKDCIKIPISCLDRLRCCFSPLFPTQRRETEGQSAVEVIYAQICIIYDISQHPVAILDGTFVLLQGVTEGRKQSIKLFKSHCRNSDKAQLTVGRSYVRIFFAGCSEN